MIGRRNGIGCVARVRQADNELRTFARLATGADSAAVIAHDALGHRQPEAHAVCVAAPREAGMKHLPRLLGQHAGAALANHDFDRSGPALERHGDRAATLDVVQPVHNQVQQHLLDFLHVDDGPHRLVRAFQQDVFLLVLGPMPDHVDGHFGQLDEVGRHPTGVAFAGEIEQAAGDCRAAEGGVVRLADVVQHRLAAGFALAGGRGGARFERGRRAGDLRHRIVDLMCHAGRQKAHAGQLLGANRLARALLNAAIQVVANLLKAGGHVVHGRGQFGHFVVRVQNDAVIEVSFFNFPRPLDQHPQRPEDPEIQGAEEQQ